jgi:hypothetical protein
MNKIWIRFWLTFALLVLTFSISAQTSTTGIVQGSVIDPQGAVVAGAEVKLVDKATNRSRVEVTNDAGFYTFSNVPPGMYSVSVTKTGFRTSQVSDLQVEVNKSSSLNLTLEVGQVSEVVQVTAGVGAELQSADAQVGNVVGTRMLRSLPTLTRSSIELLQLQPVTTPGGFGSGGTVSGARSDQNTLVLDGIDVSDNLAGGQGVAFTQSPVGVDAVSEFRVIVTNPNASFGRSAGGQISLVSPRGGNAFHGVAYWYHQNDNLNANSWINNRLGIRKGELKDNRAGFSVNGPIWKNHTFFFLNYERRRFPQFASFSRLVPTATLRGGTLRFRDAAGNVVSYPLATTTLCGTTGTVACDPRGLGISPTTAAMFALLPAGNDITLGDGLNTTGFRGLAPTSLSLDAVTGRLDHKITSKLQFMARYSYQRDLAPSATQLDIRVPDKIGVLRSLNRRGTNIISGLDYTISNNLLNSFRFGWVQNKNDLVGTNPFAVASTLGLTGTNSSIGMVGVDLGILNEAIDVAAQSARTQIILDRNIQFSDNMVWNMGRHSFNFGGEVRTMPMRFVHNDQVTFLTGPIAALASGSFLTIPATNRPPTCGGATTTNCIRSTDVSIWNNLYAATLGMLDNTSIVGARDGRLQPLPFGTDLVTDMSMRFYQFNFQDTWRMSSSLTLNLGLTYSWLAPPKEKLDRFALITDLATGDVFTAERYLEAKRRAAEQGQVYNPTIGIRPLGDSNRSSLFDTDWSNLGPRLAVAWNPSFRSGLFGRLMGDRHTVVRAGFAIVYDRVNTVTVVLPSAFAIGFGQVLQVTAPLCNASGTPGSGCDPSAGSTNRGLSAFRLGRDGSVPIPGFSGSTSPIVPAATALGVTYATDPKRKVGRNYLIDFTVQRELPGNMILETGYIGRLGRDLPTGIDLGFGSSPYFFKDAASGQTFADAYDKVACVLRGDAGKTFGSFTCPAAVQNQAWFENQLPGFGTSGMVANFSSLFLNNSVGSLFLQMSLRRLALGLPAYNNLQLAAILMATSGGKSNYHAGFVTLRNRPWHGLQYDLNFTYAKALDQVGDVQNNLSVISTGFDRNIDYGYSQADRRHVLNGIFTYDLPFGVGKRFLRQNGLLNKFVGGWYVSGIFRAYSGLPLFVTDSSSVFGGLAGVPSQGAIPLIDPSTLNGGIHSGVAGSGGVGTSGNPAAGGTGLNFFSDPEAAFRSFRRILLSQDGRQGRTMAFRGPWFWNLDFRLGKSTRITERVGIEVSADFFNIFNHVNFSTPSFSLNSPATFGVYSSTGSPRSIQLGGRVTF